jgi:hypothetical protein
MPAWVPNRWLPPDSGLQEPKYEAPLWAESLPESELETALDVARRAHATAIERAQAAEAKGGRLLGTCLALTGSSLALTGFQLSVRGPVAWWAVVLGGVAALFFSMAGVMALEVDRVGLYRPVTVGLLREHGGSKRSLVELEDHGQFLANWTASHKLTTLMHARAWFSRGLVCLIIAGILVLVDVATRKGTTPPAHCNCSITK